MNDDSISREALRRRMYHEAFETDNGMQRWDSGLWIRYKIFENAIEEAPAVETKRKRGKWLPYEFGSKRWHKCSACGIADEYINEKGLEARREFCPHCGAQMERSKECQS